MSNSQQLISHGHILVNNCVIKTKSFKIKPGDKITIDKKSRDLVEYYFLNSDPWPLTPKYLLIDYSILQIIIVENVKLTDSSHYFWLNRYNI